MGPVSGRSPTVPRVPVKKEEAKAPLPSKPSGPPQSREPAGAGGISTKSYGWLETFSYAGKTPIQALKEYADKVKTAVTFDTTSDAPPTVTCSFGGVPKAYGVGPTVNIARHVAASETLRLLIPDYKDELIVMPKLPVAVPPKPKKEKKPEVPPPPPSEPNIQAKGNLDSSDMARASAALNRLHQTLEVTPVKFTYDTVKNRDKVLYFVCKAEWWVPPELDVIKYKGYVCGEGWGNAKKASQHMAAHNVLVQILPHITTYEQVERVLKDVAWEKKVKKRKYTSGWQGPGSSNDDEPSAKRRKDDHYGRRDEYGTASIGDSDKAAAELYEDKDFPVVGILHTWCQVQKVGIPSYTLTEKDRNRGGKPIFVGTAKLRDPRTGQVWQVDTEASSKKEVQKNLAELFLKDIFPDKNMIEITEEVNALKDRSKREKGRTGSKGRGPDRDERKRLEGLEAKAREHRAKYIQSTICEGHLEAARSQCRELACTVMVYRAHPGSAVGLRGGGEVQAIDILRAPHDDPRDVALIQRIGKDMECHLGRASGMESDVAIRQRYLVYGAPDFLLLLEHLMDPVGYLAFQLVEDESLSRSRHSNHHHGNGSGGYHGGYAHPHSSHYGGGIGYGAYDSSSPFPGRGLARSIRVTEFYALKQCWGAKYLPQLLATTLKRLSLFTLNSGLKRLEVLVDERNTPVVQLCGSVTGREGERVSAGGDRIALRYELTEESIRKEGFDAQREAMGLEFKAWNPASSS